MNKFFCILLSMSLLIGSMSKAYSHVHPKEEPKKSVELVVFDVSVHCQGCKAKIERSLAFEKGVKEVEASVEHRTVTVRYKTKKTNPDKLADAIRKLGYTVRPHKPGVKDGCHHHDCDHKHDHDHGHGHGHDHDKDHKHDHNHGHNHGHKH